MEETALPIYFGEWLKLRRKKLDLTQAELAQRAGCSVFALRKIEAGVRRPSKQLAGLLAKSLEIPSEEQATFIRVARGDLNLERLRSPTFIRVADREIERDTASIPTNLPLPLTPLIGRETELAALGGLLSDPQCRLLTITGIGGIGKTRLAIELASTLQSQFPDGVLYITLASINTPEYILPAIADALGLSLSGSIDLRDQLLNYLVVRAKQSLLLVLDNLEHLLVQSTRDDRDTEIAVLITEMLRRIPKMKILTTSRERINIRVEWIFELHGLPVPASDQPQDLEGYSAAALFIQRARHANHEFEVLPDERLALMRICQLVQGTPLAIEMAAAWVGVLSTGEIAREIASNLDFLTTSMRGISERHRSLRATFEHSWKLLSLEEKRGLCRLAVFRGGFQRQAAERVAGASLSILTSLHSKSLLTRQGNGRFDLHEIIREFALPYLLEDPEGEETLRYHCLYYLDLVHGGEKGFSEVNHWVDDQTLVDELDNLRAAMSWGLWNYQVQYTLQIATALGQFWYTHGFWREGLEWLDWGLTGPGDIPDVVRAKALTVAGRLARFLGDYALAIEMLRESLTVWDNCDDRTGIAQTMCNLGAALLHQGDRESAIRLLDEALSVAKQQSDLRGRYCSLENLGHVASRHGESRRAIELYSEALVLAQEANDGHEVANLLNAIGDEYVYIEDYTQAEDCFSEAAKICQKLGNRLIGAYVSGNRGNVAMKQRNYTRAFELLCEALLQLQELGDKEDAILCLEPLAYLANAQRASEKAARLLGASESLHKLIGATRSQPNQADYDLYLADICNQLDRATFEAAWAEGCAMTYEQAIAYATDHFDNINS